MKKLVFLSAMLMAVNSYANSSRTFTDNLSGASIAIKDASGASLNASGDGLSASGQFLTDVAGTSWQVSKKITLTSARWSSDAAQYVFGGKMLADSTNASKVSVEVSVNASKEAARLARRLGASTSNASRNAARATSRASEVTVVALVDVSGTVLVTPSVASKAVSEGRFTDASSVLLYLPSNIMKAAFGGPEYHHLTIQ